MPVVVTSWMDDVQSELQEAMLHGTPPQILELTTKFSEGAERMMDLTGGTI